MRNMENYKASAAVILAGILWGITSIFIKVLSAAGLDALQIAAVRLVIAAIVFTCVLAIWKPQALKIKLRDIWLFIGTGIISVLLFNFFYFYTLIHSQASIAVILLYTSPIFVVLISALFFRERITLRKLTALGLTFAGCVLVAGFIGGAYTVTPLILLTGLASGLFYALYTIFGRLALRKYDTLTVTAYTFIIGALGSLPIMRVGDIVTAAADSPSLILWCVGVGIVCTVLPYLFYTWGLQRMESGKAAILVAVEPLVGAVIGMTLYHESHDPVKLAGIALILSAVVLLNLNGRKVKD